MYLFQRMPYFAVKQYFVSIVLSDVAIIMTHQSFFPSFLVFYTIVFYITQAIDICMSYSHSKSTAILSLWRDVRHWPPSSADFKNDCKNTSTSPLRLHGVDRENFTVPFHLLHKFRWSIFQLKNNKQHIIIVYVDLCILCVSFITLYLKMNLVKIFFNPKTRSKKKINSIQ